MKLAYPVLLTYSLESPHFTAAFPDLPGCVSHGASLADVLFSAEAAASEWLLNKLEAGLSIPCPAKHEAVTATPGSIISMVALDMDAYASRHGSRAVKKTLTIPAWLNTYAENHNISCSAILQKALSDMAQSSME